MALIAGSAPDSQQTVYKKARVDGLWTVRWRVRGEGGGISLLLVDSLVVLDNGFHFAIHQYLMSTQQQHRCASTWSMTRAWRCSTTASTCCRRCWTCCETTRWVFVFELFSPVGPPIYWVGFEGRGSNQDAARRVAWACGSVDHVDNFTSYPCPMSLAFCTEVSSAVQPPI